MTTVIFKKINLQSYKPGKSKLKSRKKIIKLSANESALGTSGKVKKLLKNIDIKISKYPDSQFQELRHAISKKFKIDKSKVICGSGSDEIIQMLCQLFLNKNDEVIVPEFSFLMYRIYSTIAGAKVIFAKEKNFKISVKNILNKITKRTKLVFLANPNNPTGTYLNRNEILDLRRKLNSKILLVLDDAYFEYMQNKDYKNSLDIFKSYKNVFILRTFSKIYGLASLRVGWGYGDKKIIKELYKIKPPFNVTKVAQLCAKEALKDENFINKSIKHNNFWCKKIKEELKKYQIITNDISTNFFLLNFTECKYSADYVSKKLEEYGVILREMKSYGINNCLRLTIGNRSENEFFLDKIRRIFKNV